MAWWGRKQSEDWNRQDVPVHENQTDDKSSSSSDSFFLVIIISTGSEWNSEAHEFSTSSSDQFQKSSAAGDGDESSCNDHTDCFAYGDSEKAQLRSTSLTERGAEPTTPDVPPQPKHPRGVSSQVDVHSMTVVGVTIAGSKDEDPAEYFNSHQDVGELPDPLVDGAEADETTKGSWTTDRSESERDLSQVSSRAMQ